MKYLITLKNEKTNGIGKRFTIETENEKDVKRIVSKELIKYGHTVRSGFNKVLIQKQ